MFNGVATHEETEFLSAISQPMMDSERINNLAVKIEHFDHLMDVARSHGVLPLLCYRLVESKAKLPAGYAARIQDELCTNLAQNLAAASELLILLDAFAHNGIPALPFKGVTLADSIYGKIGFRPAGDLDVLIYHKDLSKAAGILIHHGYQLRTPIQADDKPLEFGKYEYHFERPSDGMIVELRWRLTQSHFHADLGMDWLWPRRRTSTLLGSPVPAMSAEHMLILLGLHGSKHGWSRLIWLCDISQLLVSHPNLDWNRAVRDANHFGLSRSLALGVLLAKDVVGARIPKGAERYLQREPHMLDLARRIKENLFDDAKRIPNGRVPYHVQLLGFGDRLRWRWRMRPFTPNQLDRTMIRLPKTLDFLYYFIRPLRLMRDYWRRNLKTIGGEK
jgi:hypothetical protein